MDNKHNSVFDKSNALSEANVKNLVLNLAEIQENIARAAQKSGRKADDITLVAVTKTISLESIAQAAKLGIKHFGENRVQEFLTKYEQLDTSTWHMIGHLQTNKVKFIIDKVALIHSVDSVRLAQEIDKRAKQHNIVADILIEINIADEDTKHGVPPEKAKKLIEHIHFLQNICIRGLMCVAPYVEESEHNRVYYEKMQRLFVDINSSLLHNVDMRFLSMGMSGDYQIAIEEGANIVRIGTSLFGERNR